MNTSGEIKTLIKDKNYRELRCKNKRCNKLLGRIDKGYKIGYLELKCPKCKTINKYGVEALEAQD